MKSRNSFLTFALLLITISLSAQVSLGLRTGVTKSNMSTISAIDAVTPDFKTITGTEIAAIAEIAISDKFAIQPELVYTTKGFKIKEGLGIDLFGFDLPLGLEAVTKLKYVEMPVLAKYKFGNNRLKGYISAGPSVGYAAKGKLKSRAKVIIDIPIYNTDINLDNADRFDISANIGMGMSLSTKGGGQVFLDARYSHGFNGLDNISVIDLEAKNRSFGLTAGFLAPL